jgi:hypothetical protein
MNYTEKIEDITRYSWRTYTYPPKLAKECTRHVLREGFKLLSQRVRDLKPMHKHAQHASSVLMREADYPDAFIKNGVRLTTDIRTIWKGWAGVACTHRALSEAQDLSRSLSLLLAYLNGTPFERCERKRLPKHSPCYTQYPDHTDMGRAKKMATVCEETWHHVMGKEAPVTEDMTVDALLKWLRT